MEGFAVHLLLPKGNAEFLVWLDLSAEKSIEISQLIEGVLQVEK